jgi:hypothetical protein
MAELEAMELRPSQYAPGEEVPEKSLFYRLAKKFFFNDFGAYERLDPSAYPVDVERWKRAQMAPSIPGLPNGSAIQNGTVDSPVEIHLN